LAEKPACGLLERSTHSGHIVGMDTKRPARPRDMNQLAKRIVDISIGEAGDEPTQEQSEKNPHAVALGRLGGLRGGRARAERMTSERRREIARVAARSRWNKRPPK
jgi:hypothetical protein